MTYRKTPVVCTSMRVNAKDKPYNDSRSFIERHPLGVPHQAYRPQNDSCGPGLSEISIRNGTTCSASTGSPSAVLDFERSWIQFAQEKTGDPFNNLPENFVPFQTSSRSKCISTKSIAVLRNNEDKENVAQNSLYSPRIESSFGETPPSTPTSHGVISPRMLSPVTPLKPHKLEDDFGGATEGVIISNLLKGISHTSPRRLRSELAQQQQHLADVNHKTSPNVKSSPKKEFKAPVESPRREKSFSASITISSYISPDSDSGRTASDTKLGESGTTKNSANQPYVVQAIDDVRLQSSSAEKLDTNSPDPGSVAAEICESTIPEKQAAKKNVISILLKTMNFRDARKTTSGHNRLCLLVDEYSGRMFAKLLKKIAGNTEHHSIVVRRDMDLKKRVRTEGELMALVEVLCTWPSLVRVYLHDFAPNDLDWFVVDKLLQSSLTLSSLEVRFMDGANFEVNKLNRSNAVGIWEEGSSAACIWDKGFTGVGQSFEHRQASNCGLLDDASV